MSPTDGSGPVATVTLYPSSQQKGVPSLEEIESGLLVAFPADRFAIQHRAMVIDNETHIVIDVYRS